MTSSWDSSEAGKKYQKKWYQDNKERITPARKAYAKRHYALNKERIAARKAAHRKANRDLYRDRKLQQDYGITLKQYEAMEVAQGFSCAICKGRKKLNVDHDHVTSLVRGLLCGSCNRAIGLLQDSPKLCYASGDYLKR